MEEQEKDTGAIETPVEEKEGAIQQATPSTDSAAPMEAEIKKLTESLEQKTKETEENYNKFLRACADLENYKKRVEKEKGELISFSNERLIKELIPVVDNLERAIDHIEDESDLSAIKDGIKLVMDSLLAVLNKFGIEVASAVCEKFDPKKHEAVSQEESCEYEPGTVIKEFHKCYYLNGRLLRPAMVVIVKPPETLSEIEVVPAEKG